jgi:hypothetical protein
MGFLRKPSRPSRLLPEDLGRMLAEYGYYEFDASSAPMPSSDTIELMSRIQFDNELQARGTDLVEELVEASIATGGWATHGAPAFIDAFLPSQSGTTAYFDLYARRLIHFRGLGLRICAIT